MDLESQASVCVGIISDTHGAIENPILVLMQQCDVIVHAGDILDPDILRRATPKSGHIIAVRGNNDTAEQWPRGTARLLESLPETALLKLPGGVLVVEHGHRVNPAHQRHEKLRARHPNARVIVYGHTHHRVVDTQEPIWVLNPGAAGKVRAYGGAGCLVLHATAAHWWVEEKTLSTHGSNSA
ncbi:MAG TPA: YfcE family phosphodiesterase [Halothiobacillus sp.]|nr:MAG: YfcE family phosphodiesterase [Halothiobacillus sp. 20-54-6]HQT43808.1 YfcE family phosphodiesterase [Halothiobacillus sp.]